MRLRNLAIVVVVAASIAVAVSVNSAFGLFCFSGDGPFDYWQDCF